MADKRKKLAEILLSETDFTNQPMPGMFDMKSLAEKEAIKRYGADTQHNGNADAFRHLAWSGMMANKYGNTLPKFIGWAHEKLEPGQPSAEESMDMKNNMYGRYIGSDAKNLQQVMDRAKLLVDYGIAPTMKSNSNY